MEPAEALFQGVRNCIQSPCMPEHWASLPFPSCVPIAFQSKLSIAFFSVQKPYTVLLVHLRVLAACVCDSDPPGPVLVP